MQGFRKKVQRPKSLQLQLPSWKTHYRPIPNTCALTFHIYVWIQRKSRRGSKHLPQPNPQLHTHTHTHYYTRWYSPLPSACVFRMRALRTAECTAIWRSSHFRRPAASGRASAPVPPFAARACWSCLLKGWKKGRQKKWEDNLRTLSSTCVVVHHAYILKRRTRRRSTLLERFVSDV